LSYCCFSVHKTQVLRMTIWILFFSCLNLPVTICGLAKVAIFTTNVDAENWTFCNHKCVCGVRNRHFCQTAVRCWRSGSCCSVIHCLQCLGAVAWWLFWIFFALVNALEKNTNVPPNALAMLSYILFSSLCHLEFLKICLFGLVFQVLKLPLLSSEMACKLYHSRV